MELHSRKKSELGICISITWLGPRDRHSELPYALMLKLYSKLQQFFSRKKDAGIYVW
jgi:hypothetical protein